MGQPYSAFIQAAMALMWPGSLHSQRFKAASTWVVPEKADAACVRCFLIRRTFRIILKSGNYAFTKAFTSLNVC